MSRLMADIECEETRQAEIGNALDNYTPKSYDHAGGSHSEDLTQSPTHEGESQAHDPNDTSHDTLANLLSKQKLCGDALYVPAWSRWMLWNGSRWRPDDRLHHMTMVRDFLRFVASTEGDPRKAADLKSDKTRTAVERTVRSNPEIAAGVDLWDADTMLLGTPGGTVDLRTGELREADRSDFITRQTSVTPAPSGTRAPIFKAFMERIFCSKPEIIPFMQRAAGYSLTGKTNEHKLLFAFGGGRNGKSVFFGTLEKIMGDYSIVAHSSTFMESASEQHPTDMAMLAGARLVTASELPPGKAWDEARIKAMTGGDPVTARRMRQDFFTYTPQFTLMISGNHMPSFRGVDEAIRSRVLLIPFAETIPEEERDPKLADNLRDEWPAILRWAIDGALEWQNMGLCPPEVITSASEEYLESEDMLGEFISDCLIGCPDGFVTNKDLYAEFRQWCQNSGMHSPWTQHALTRALTERGYEQSRRSQGRGLLGYSIKSASARSYQRAKYGE